MRLAEARTEILTQAAAKLIEKGKLASALYTFSHHFHLQILAEEKYRPHDRFAFRIVIHLIDKGAIDLQPFERELVEIAQARVSGSESRPSKAIDREL
jgi:hypothetical protein